MRRSRQHGLPLATNKYVPGLDVVMEEVPRVEVVQPLQDVPTNPKNIWQRYIARRIGAFFDRPRLMEVHGDHYEIHPVVRDNISLMNVHEVVVVEAVTDLCFPQQRDDCHTRG